MLYMNAIAIPKDPVMRQLFTTQTQSTVEIGLLVDEWNEVLRHNANVYLNK